MACAIFDGDTPHGLAFFDGDTPHGLAKRFMYKRYLQAFIPVTQKYYTTLILDGFAGKGKYGEEWPPEIEKYGSPVIALRVAVEFFNRDQRFQLYSRHGETSIKPYQMDKNPKYSINVNEIKSRIILIFVEKDETNFWDLVHNVCKTFDCYGVDKLIEPDGDHINIRVEDRKFSICCMLYNTSFDKVEAPEGPGSTRYLTFVDPFGYKHFPMRHIKKFMGHGRSIFLNMMSSFVNRFLSKTPRHIAALYGLDIPSHIENEDEVADYVKEHVRRGDQDDLTNCVRNYEQALRQNTGASYVLEFEMRNKSNVRLYHLIFATNHIKDVEIMKESMVCGTQEQGSLALSDFKILRKHIEMNLRNDQIDTAAADAIYKKYQGEVDVPIDDVKDFTYTETPFVFRKKALKVLEKDRKVLSVRGPNDDQRSRWTYRDGVNWLLTFEPYQQLDGLEGEFGKLGI